MTNRIIDRFGTTMLRFSRRSTVHGVNHMAQARNAQRRIFWLCISFSASLGFLVNMFYLLQKFWQTPILTNLYHDADSFVYPDFTFCQTNPMYFPPNGTQERIDLENYVTVYNTLKAKYQNSVYLMSDHIFMSKNLNFVHPKWSSIVHCKFMRINCNEDDFDFHAIWPYSSCYTLNITKLKRASRIIDSSKHRSLFKPDFRLVVYKSLNYPPEYQSDPHGDIYMPSGILLMIHEPGTSPFIGNSIIIDGGTQIEIKVIDVKHLASLGKCDPNKVNYTYGDLFTNQSHAYIGRRHDCQSYSLQATIAEHCKCQHMQMARPAAYLNLTFCSKEHYSCLDRASKENIKKCFRDQCEHMSIRRVIAQTAYPAVNDRYSHLQWLKTLAELESRELDHFNNHSDLAEKALIDASFGNCADAYKNKRTDLLNVSFVNRNFMMFRIVPSALYMDKVVETEEYPLSRLFSDIGGCVGLWIGASLITIFECVDLLFDIFDSVTLNREPANEISSNNTKLKQSLLRKHTAQTYILGGKPIWEEPHEDHVTLYDINNEKFNGSGKVRPPTPPFYHSRQANATPINGSEKSFGGTIVPIFYADELSRHSSQKSS